MQTTNLGEAEWQPVPENVYQSGTNYVVIVALTDSSHYYRLQQGAVGLGGACLFQAAPAVIQAGTSSTLTWCPLPNTTYSLFPGPGTVTGGSFTVSPTATTVYSLTASNALGTTTNFATVVVQPCGWLQVNSWDVELYASYHLNPSTADYTFEVDHWANRIRFHLTRQGPATATDAHYFGFATGGTGFIHDREDAKVGPRVYTTTEDGEGPIALNVSTMSLHVTCSTYDFSYNILINETETSDFGVYTSFDGLATGAMQHPLPTDVGWFRDTAYDPGAEDLPPPIEVPAHYPPIAVEYFAPDSDLGKAMFTTGTATSATGGNAHLTWRFTPDP